MSLKILMIVFPFLSICWPLSFLKRINHHPSGSVWFCKLDGIYQNIFIDGWVEFLDVKFEKWAILFIRNINKSYFKTESAFLHWLKWSSEISFLLIFSMISLIALVSSFFAGLVNRKDGFLKCNESRCSCYRLDAVIQVHEVGNLCF